jgi:YidC/Oxa1 family membrane protein insertase
VFEIIAANPLQPIIDGSEAILKFWAEDVLGGGENSWGFGIILLTFTIRLLILPLTFKSVKSMQKLQVLQPEMKKIQERYKEDRQRMNQEMMKFYQENKVNPLGSCLPLLLQIPFFISLFYLLRSDEFKTDIEGEESFFFIPDLAAPLTDEPLILAFMIVLYVGTQLIASVITMVGGDKTQQRIMFALPFVFTIFIINFEAGLIVYWITTNVWTIGQQLVVRKLYPKPQVLAETGHAAAALVDDGDGGKPARGKPAAKAAEGGNGGTATKAPPKSPRKKKKRSGRRR